MVEKSLTGHLRMVDHEIGGRAQMSAKEDQKEEEAVSLLPESFDSSWDRLGNKCNKCSLFVDTRDVSKGTDEIKSRM